ncbi:hypothetical protein EDC01DRAFT_652040 [Geopyxis carbonaria]|nr:hypothetical protein EDC01DRAFT_652040 [Geopyxis carbonaria]
MFAFRRIVIPARPLRIALPVSYRPQMTTPFSSAPPKPATTMPNPDTNVDLITKLSARAATSDPATASWYIIATAAFAAANEPQRVTDIYKTACALRTVAERRVIFRRIRETLLKSTMLIGLPRMLNAYFPLAAHVLATEGAETLGDWGDSVRGRGNAGDVERRRRGEEYLGNIYRGEVPRIRANMEPIAPEVWDACILGYSEYLSEMGVLGRVETSQVTIACMVPLDVKTEVGWHMRGLIRNDGTVEHVREALEISLSVCEAAGVELKHGIPDMGVVAEERLFDG